ncbi:hypothetical protein ACHAQJ_007812 [Trichoderma viride]
MAEDESDYVDCSKDEAASVASTVSWNTFLSRTNISSLTHAVFSEQETQFLHGLDDVIRAVTALGLRRYRYEDIAREEKIGEGETYIVERCVVAGQVLAVKHLKTSSALDDDTSRRRLRAVILELQIMRHRPLRNHPNFPFAFGYGWNMNDNQIMPYILVQYAPKGTLRQHLKSMASRASRQDVQILAGDVASALSALHKCGIVHGDVKLDNVLVVHSWDRPSQVLAKVTDFGHALVVNDRSSKHGGTLRYGGTFMYNAPEVHDQDIFPIYRAAMPQCDIWAFGLLVWELCLQGEDHVSYSNRSWPEAEHQMTDQRLDPADVRRYALASVPGQIDYILIRATMHRTLQEDPTNRIAHLEDLPLLTEWNDIGINGLESELALHLESPSLTYEMFRPENGREIPWKHEEQIFQGLKRAQAKKRTKDNSSISWQLAICHHVGFGTPRSPTSAFQYAKVAQEEGHTVAAVFASLLCPNPTASPEPYVRKISTLFRSSIQSRFPPVIQACFDNDSNTLISLLFQQQDPNSSTVDGCTMFHWFFMLEDPEAIVEILESVYKEPIHLHASLPFSYRRKAHDQWPLQLHGTPLGTAILVNSLPTVRALLAFGANPLDHVYRSEDFPAGDPKISWTALHMASKYHCSEILQYLLLLVPKASLSALCPLASALPFSTSLERLAMHGAHRQEELDKTIDAIRSVQSLQTPSLSGMTALTQAIDFQDYDVVAALLRAEPELASIPLASVENPAVFNLPIHLAAQLAARRDVPEALSILQLINSYTEDLNAKTNSSRDHLGMTPLHLAVTGPSCRATRWILDQCIGLLELEDNLGRTALHGCASDDNLEFLLIKGSAINQTDKYGMTALHRASIRGELELVRCLLKHSPPLDLMNNTYGTPLHCAVINGSVDVVRALLEAGAPLNTQDRKGNTPVHVAVRMGRYMILRNLLEKGGSRSIQNVNGRTPEDLASSIGTTHSIATLHILQGGQKIGRKAEAATYLFSENNADANYMSHARIRDQRTRDRNNSDFAWDANDGAPKVFSESYTSGQEEAGPIGDEELPALLDGRKEKKKKLQDIVAAINDAYSGITSSLKDEFVPYLQALIIPYLDDSVWQNDEPSPIPIGRVLAVTAFRLGMIMEMLEEGHWSNRLASNNLTRAPESRATPIGNQGDGAEKKTQDAANNEAENERDSSVTEDSSKAGKETRDKPPIKDKEEANSKSFRYSKAAKFICVDPLSAWKDKQMNPPAFSRLEDNMKVAIDQIIKMVEQTKPAWALPAWSQWHFKTTITWEVNRIQTASDASYLDTLLADKAGSMDQSLHLSWTTKDRKPTRIQLQQYKWRIERELFQSDSFKSVLSAHTS